MWGMGRRKLGRNNEQRGTEEEEKLSSRHDHKRLDLYKVTPKGNKLLLVLNIQTLWCLLIQKSAVEVKEVELCGFSFRPLLWRRVSRGSIILGRRVQIEKLTFFGVACSKRFTLTFMFTEQRTRSPLKPTSTHQQSYCDASNSLHCWCLWTVLSGAERLMDLWVLFLILCWSSSFGSSEFCLVWEVRRAFLLVWLLEFAQAGASLQQISVWRKVLTDFTDDAEIFYSV